ncbi:XK-related protein 5-like [Zophobas morio]|uniref:XK-related protein 5-like n=1 Tax=Zophobas morio TaxID=2755281 RepID=UPI003082FBC2
MEPSPDCSTNCVSNGTTDNLYVGDSAESDETVEEYDPSICNGVTQPSESLGITYKISERGDLDPNNSASTNRTINPMAGQDEDPLCHENNCEEATEKHTTKLEVFLKLGATFLYVFNVTKFYDTIIYQSYDNFSVYSLTSIIYLISAFVTTCFSWNINQFKPEQKEYNFYTRGILIAAFASFEIYHIYFRIISGPQSYGQISLTILWHLFTTITLFIIFQLFTLEIYVLMSVYAIKSLSKSREGQQDYYYLLTKTQADVGLLGLLDGAFRTIPHQILQIYNFFKFGFNLGTFWYFDQIAVLFSFFAIAWCSTSYQSSLRVHLPNKYDMNLKTKCWYYTWSFFICISRILCIGAIAALWPVAVVILSFGHCAGWAFWLWWNHPSLDFTRNSKYWHILFCCVIGVVYFTFPINLDDKPTKKKYCVFYGLMLLKNCVGILIWYFNEDASWGYFVLILAIGSTGLGMIFQILYYAYYHPTKVYDKNIAVPVQ